MCKHKSGGMSKPSGAGTQQSGLDERSTASFPSHTGTCPQEAAHGATAPQANSNSTYNPSSSSAMRGFPHLSDMESGNTHNFHPADEGLQQKYETMSLLPNVVQETTAAEYSDSQDSEEDDTEQSPMLMNDTCSLYVPPPPSDSWSPNVDALSKLKQNSLTPKYVDQHGCCRCGDGKMLEDKDVALDCDNFPLYSNFPAQTNFQASARYVQPQYDGFGAASFLDDTMNVFNDSRLSGISDYNYSSKNRKKWFINQKCKSADSEPDPFKHRISSVCERGLASFDYDYAQNASAMGGCSGYPKPSYNDPVAGPSGLQRPSSINWEMKMRGNKDDDEFRSRSYSLTPTVNFAVFESESSSDAEDLMQEPIVAEPVLEPDSKPCTKTIEDPFEMPLLSLGKMIPISASAAQLSIASSYGDNGSPICKICHMTAKENDPLISPCRCSGTMQYIHCGCLMRWLEVCNKRSRKPASCELCQYQYHWHKKFKIRHWQMPQCSRRDKILHLLFFLSLTLMIACASITVLCFKQDKGTKVDADRTELTQSEIVTLICGVLFFIAFFVAMYVEVKSHNTLYELLVKFVHINQQWYIDEYEKKEAAPVAV